MKQKKDRSIQWILISGVGGIILFLAILAVLTYYSYYIENSLLNLLLTLLSENIGLIIVLCILFMAADLFDVFEFPMNLPAPLFRATGSVFLVAFLFNILISLDRTMGNGTVTSLQVVEFMIYPLIFLIVLFFGYISIFRRVRDADHAKNEQAADAGTRSPGVKSWDEIGEEFRQLVYDILHYFRDEIRRK